MAFSRVLGSLFQRIDRKLPTQVPALSGKFFLVFRVAWWLALAAAICVPLAGLYLSSDPRTTPRYSDYVFGSRLGLSLDPNDARNILGPVGDDTRKAGVRRGDELVAVNGHPAPAGGSGNSWTLGEPDRSLIDLIANSNNAPARLTVRARSGQVRSMTLMSGEQHLKSEIKRIPAMRWMRNLMRLIGIAFYLLFIRIAAVLHFRNSRQFVPELLSFSILLMVGNPAGLLVDSSLPTLLMELAGKLSATGVVAAMLLFPDGRLTPRQVLVPLLMLPLILILPLRGSGAFFLLVLMVLGIRAVVRRARQTSGAAQQQLKFLSMGVGGLLAVFAVTFGLVHWKSGATSLQTVLFLGMAIQIASGLGVAVLLLMLFAALRRHRLYDADALFSRSAMIALLTLTIAAFFAGASAALQAAADALFGQGAGPWPTVVAAAAAVLLINPVQTRIYRGTKRVFQKDLFRFRTELPKRMDDLRETASAGTLLEVALNEIVRGLRAIHAAALINGRVAASVGHKAKDVRRWVRSTELPDPPRLSSHRADHLFPLRMPLRTATDPPQLIGWIIVGPRPDGSLYSREERQALFDVEESISRAVEVARQREQAQSVERRWRDRQEKRLRALEAGLETLFAQVSARRLRSS